MKTTLDLPAELVREMKLRAAGQGRKLRDVATEIFRRGLAQTEQPGTELRSRVKLPLIECGKPMAPGREMSPGQVADVLLQQEVAWHHESAGR